MQNVYQLIFLGDESRYSELIINRLLIQTEILGINNQSIKVINEFNFKEYIPNNPTYCLYFGTSNSQKNTTLVETLIKDATLILPIVSNVNLCSELIPESLKAINAFELSCESKVNSLISCILEGFSLLRASRRLFISYRRAESSKAAIQLYEALEKAGFDVFLDTHSIRPDKIFQEELWHRMADSDIVILLNTLNFLESQWTKEELSRASAMSIGVIQVIWPNSKPLSESELFTSIHLQTTDITSQEHLQPQIISQLISDTESLRARTLAARQDNLTTEFINICHTHGINAVLHPYKFITLTIHNTNYLIIPAVGVPQSLTSHDIYELKQEIRKDHVEKIYLLYDHTYLKKEWLKHLDWLNDYLPVTTLKLLEIENLILNKKSGESI